jgi:hypothetical protein
MAKDLIIGGASNYTWDQLKYWVNSIKMSGFTGDVVLVGTNLTKETIDRLTQEGVILSLHGKENERGDIVAHGGGAPHVERFFYMWNYLMTTTEKYIHVITTDTRDVVFQSNPSDWLYDNLEFYHMVCSSEGMRYKNEPWGNKNLLETFGPYFHEALKEKTIYNVGTIAGNFEYVRDLLLSIFQMSVNRPIPIVDQAVFNFLLNLTQYNLDALCTDNTQDWAIQLGTTLEAVKAGKGDLGVNSNLDDYLTKYEDVQPMFDDGIVKDPSGKPYTIVHQYDRVPFLKEKIEQKYGV